MSSQTGPVTPHGPVRRPVKTMTDLHPPPHCGYFRKVRGGLGCECTRTAEVVGVVGREAEKEGRGCQREKGGEKKRKEGEGEKEWYTRGWIGREVSVGLPISAV